MTTPAIFLDRDGVLNQDPGYVHRVEDLVLFDDVGPALRELQDQKFKLIVISNQSGIGRGMFKYEDAQRFNQAMAKELETRHDVNISGFYICPHAPQEGCNCRKPATQMVDQAIQEHKIDRNRSWFIGDKQSDVECGENAGIRSVLLTRSQSSDLPDTIDSLQHFADLVKKKVL